LPDKQKKLKVNLRLMLTSSVSIDLSEEPIAI